jgi:hypothetical protein
MLFWGHCCGGIRGGVSFSWSSVAVAAVKASETGFIIMSERNLLASHEYISCSLAVSGVCERMSEDAFPLSYPKSFKYSFTRSQLLTWIDSSVGWNLLLMSNKDV